MWHSWTDLYVEAVQAYVISRLLCRMVWIKRDERDSSDTFTRRPGNAGDIFLAYIDLAFPRHSKMSPAFVVRNSAFSQLKSCTMGDAFVQLPYAVNPLPFDGKVIAVTGASRGLGLALTKYLLARGATVSMCATSTERLAKAVVEIERELPDARGRYWTCQVDIKEISQVRTWVEQTVAKYGTIDGCANVAGMFSQALLRYNLLLKTSTGVAQHNMFPITDLDPEYFADIVQTNIIGTFNCLKEEMKVIKEGGSIVNVGSVTGQYAAPGVSAYVASKHALVGLSKVAALEGASRRVRVNTFSP